MLYQEKLQAGENSEKKRLSCFIFSKSKSFPNHCHMHLEIIYILQNKAIIYLDGKARVCKRGDLVFVPMLIPHAISDVDGEPFLLMVIQLDTNLLLEDGQIELSEKKMVLRGKKLLKELACCIDEYLIMRHILLELQHICESQPKGGFFSNNEKDSCSESIIATWKLKGLVYSLFSEMIYEELIGFSKETRDFGDIRELSRIQSILKLMISQPEKKLSMEEASKMVCMSYFNFCRTFKQVLGHSFVEYQNMLRIRRAEELLYESNMSIAEISEALSFGTISYFNRTFKKYTGINPSDSRKRALQKSANIKQITK